jgi:hypothetical protein
VVQLPSTRNAIFAGGDVKAMAGTIVLRLVVWEKRSGSQHVSALRGDVAVPSIKNRCGARKRCQTDRNANNSKNMFGLASFDGWALKMRLDQRFRNSNHIRQPYRAYRPTCERRGAD